MTEQDLTSALREFIGMSARDFVPHREPMLLLDSIVDIGADYVLCDWQCRDSAFVDADAGVPAYTSIETMAQCIAVHAGARARIEGRAPPMGLLLGTRHFRSAIQYLEPGGAYTARCDALFSDGQGMSSFACELWSEGARVASAKLAVLEWLPDQTA